MNLAFYEMDYTKFTFRGLLLQLFFYEFVKDREKIAVGVRNRLIGYCRSISCIIRLKLRIFSSLLFIFVYHYSEDIPINV